MRVAFDQQVFLLQEYGGISRYVCSLSRSLSAIPGVKVKIVAPLHFNDHLAALPPGLSWGARVPRVRKTTRLIAGMTNALAPPLIRLFRPQIVHETYYSHIGSAPTGCRTVVTVYDMIHERFPEMFEHSHMTSEPKRAATLRADHVLCISENTRRDLIQTFGIPEHKVATVHIGYEKLEPANKLPKNIVEALQKPYLFYVGSRAPYKNFEALLRAYAMSSFLRSNFSLVCFGGGAFRADELAQARRLNVSEPQLVQIAGDDGLLADLYKTAALFVYPSLYEGFGMPLLEAMSLDCPVVCSNTSSFPEVAGDAAEYFDPLDDESLNSAIEDVLRSCTKRRALVEKGRLRCATFSWERCARETLEVYRRLL